MTSGGPHGTRYYYKFIANDVREKNDYNYVKRDLSFTMSVFLN